MQIQRLIDLDEQLVIAMKHKKIQESLLEKGEQITFDKAINIARRYETTMSQLEQLESEKRDINPIKENKQAHVQQRQETDEIEMQLQSQTYHKIGAQDTGIDA